MAGIVQNETVPEEMEKPANEIEEPPAELEGEMILRLPPHMADHLRNLLRGAVKDLHKRLRIEIDPSDMRHATVKLDDWVLSGKIYDLPCITETFKTFDRKMFYKVSDVGQIIVCEEKKETVEEDEKPYLFHEYLDKEGRDKRYLFPHGLTPCLKNVRKRRFRKTLRNKCSETPFIQKEVRRLLQADSEAISYRFELIDLNDEKLKNSDNKEDASEAAENHSLGEFDIFGAILSSSEDSDEDTNADCIDDAEKSKREYADVQKNADNFHMPCKNENELPEDESFNNPQSAIESEAAGVNLGEILKCEKTDNEKEELFQELQELEQEISALRAQKRMHEIEMINISNSALKQKFQMGISSLKVRETVAQKKYDEIASVLFS